MNPDQLLPTKTQGSVVVGGTLGAIGVQDRVIRVPQKGMYESIAGYTPKSSA